MATFLASQSSFCHGAMSFLNLEMGGRRLLLHSLLAAWLAFPWLSPYTAGPTPNAWPWLLSATCAVVLWLFQRRLNARLIAGGWLVAACLSALIGLAQYFGLALDFSPWVNPAKVGTAFGNVRQPNQLATGMSIGLVALIALLALQQGVVAGDQGRPALPWWVFACALLLAMGNAASGSRTGLLQWLLIPTLTAWWVLRTERRLAVFALLVLLGYGVAVAALPWLLELLTGVHIGGLFGRLVEAPTCQSRKILWSNVLQLIAQKPWLGWGWGELDYAHYITPYSGERFCEILDNAHNLPLHLAVELGVPVAVAVCAGLTWAVWRARPWRETDPTRQMAWAVLAVIMLHSMLEYPLWYGPFQMAVGLCVWLLWPVARQRAGETLDGSRWAPLLRGGVAAALLAALAYAAWDYRRVSQIYLAPAARDAAYREDTMAKISGSWLFRNQVQFAALTTAPLLRSNAQWTFDTATALLHFSPEPRVIEKVIESAVMLGRDADALLHLARYRAAFPKEHAQWRKANGLVSGAAPGQGAAM